MNIFVVDAFSLNDEIIGEFDEKSIGLHKDELGVFSSLEKAEKMIHDWLEHVSSWHVDVFGFVVKEKTVDESFSGFFNEISQWKTYRTYTKDGKLNCASLCDETGTDNFSGRKDQVRLRKGEYAWLLCDHSIIPVRICELPYTENEWKSRFKKNVKGDFTDDAYTTVTMDYEHDHPFSPRVFPTTIKFSNRVKKALDKQYNKYFDSF